MWGKIYEIIKDIFLLQRESQQNKEDIKELRKEVKEIRDEFQKLVLIVQKLSFDIQHVSEREQSERREMAL